MLSKLSPVIFCSFDSFPASSRNKPFGKFKVTAPFPSPPTTVNVHLFPSTFSLMSITVPVPVIPSPVNVTLSFLASTRVNFSSVVKVYIASPSLFTFPLLNVKPLNSKLVLSTFTFVILVSSNKLPTLSLNNPFGRTNTTGPSLVPAVKVTVHVLPLPVNVPKVPKLAS